MASLLLQAAGPAYAAPAAEVGDAGQLPATAQQPQGAGPLDSIAGTLDQPGDADLYRICLSGGGSFSATTEGTPGTLNDTQLFLFDGSGMGVVANDDSPSSFTFRSTLPTSAAPAAGGVYYLGISAFDDDPASNVPASSAGLIFPSTPFRGVFGPTGPGGGQPLADWTGTTGQAGSYTIALTGVVHCPPDVVCTSPPPPPPGAIVGTAGPDVLVGTPGPDFIFGLGGADRIAGQGGDDLILGGDGDDQIGAGAGADTACGQSGNDSIAGGEGGDLLSGGPGQDRLSGDDGDDLVLGGSGTDVVVGGPGTDVCRTGGNPGDSGDPGSCETLTA